MIEKTPRPAARGGAHRAAGSEALSGSSGPQLSTMDPQTLAAALQRGATLHLGRYEHPLRLSELQTRLKNAFAFDGDYRRNHLLGPTAICAHWLGFTGQRNGLNHQFPATFLHELITRCFGLDYAQVPMDAVLAGLIWQGFQVERVKAKGLAPFNWAANIRSVTYPPGGDSLIRITELGKRCAILPIRIWE
jgi:hypothetical protein